MTITLLAILVFACDSRAPDPLPPSRYAAPTVIGRALRHGDMTGYLSRPRDRGSETGHAVLQLVDQLDEAARQRSDTRAADGAVVLTVPSTTETAAALRYLEGLPLTAEVITECHRVDC